MVRTRNMLVMLATLCICSLFISASVAASSVRRHDGFYLRVQSGYANIHSKATGYSDGTELVITGTDSLFRLDIGGALKENLILYGTIGGAGVYEPEVRLNGVEYTASETFALISDIGIGMTYYIMPANVYVGGTLNMTQNKLVDDDYNSLGSSDNGFGLYMNIGKEWWISGNWGLGLAIFDYFGYVPDTGGGNIRNRVFGILLSATFN